jgi:hypothetical protein
MKTYTLTEINATSMANSLALFWRESKEPTLVILHPDAVEILQYALADRHEQAHPPFTFCGVPLLRSEDIKPNQIVIA